MSAAFAFRGRLIRPISTRYKREVRGFTFAQMAGRTHRKALSSSEERLG